jgi:hypothetical protein
VLAATHNKQSCVKWVIQGLMRYVRTIAHGDVPALDQIEFDSINDDRKASLS